MSSITVTSITIGKTVKISIPGYNSADAHFSATANVAEGATREQAATELAQFVDVGLLREARPLIDRLKSPYDRDEWLRMLTPRPLPTPDTDAVHEKLIEKLKLAKSYGPPSGLQLDSDEPEINADDTAELEIDLGVGGPVIGTNDPVSDGEADEDDLDLPPYEDDDDDSDDDDLGANPADGPDDHNAYLASLNDDDSTELLRGAGVGLYEPLPDGWPVDPAEGYDGAVDDDDDAPMYDPAKEPAPNKTV